MIQIIGKNVEAFQFLNSTVTVLILPLLVLLLNPLLKLCHFDQLPSMILLYMFQD